MSLDKEAAIGVVGAGIVGTSTAYYLTKLGYHNVTVYEAVDVAHAASGRAGGFLARGWCDGGPTRSLARAGFDLHAELAVELGMSAEDIGYRPVRTIALTLRNEGEKSSCQQGGDTTLPAWVNSGSVADSDEIGSPDNTAQVHPGQLTRALLAAAQAGGAQLVRQRVVGVSLSADKSAAESLQLADGSSVVVDVVVLAMGPWTGGGLADFFGLKSRGGALAVDGSRAHSILLQPPPDAAIDATALFLTVRDEHRKCLDPEVYPRPDGTVYVCLGGDDPAPLPANPADVVWDEAACQGLARIAAQVSDRLAAADCVQQKSACYLPNPRDGRGPLLGRLPGVRGAYVAAGHSCWGILQGPISGKLMAELISSGETSIDIAAFAPDRLIK